jgi:putative Holliday junction resolvase
MVSPAVSQGGTLRSEGRVLAIDYGRRRLGLAVSDPLRVAARPLATWTRSNRRHDLARLRSLCREQGITRIVVGWPLQLSGAWGDMASEAASFAERIRKDLGIPVELVDERLSSWEAAQVLVHDHATKGRSPNPKHPKRRRLDEVAAAVILRDYLHGADKGA